MNPNSLRLVISTNTTAHGFNKTEYNVACGNDTNVLVTLGEPYVPPYTALYMCDVLCVSKSVNPLGFIKQPCYIENCNQNSTVYLFSLPLVGTWGCFFPFFQWTQSGAYPSFWPTVSLLTLLCLTGFVLNVSLIVMSNMKRLASCKMRKIIVGVCAFEALAAVILYLDPVLHWELQGGPADTIMHDYFHPYVIDPTFVRTFCSYLLLVVACHLQAFHPVGFDRMTKSKLTILSFCLSFPVLIYFLYFLICHPVAQLVENAVVNSTLLTGVVEFAMDKSVIGGIIFAHSFLFGLIMNILTHCGLSSKLAEVSGTSITEKLKDMKSCALCISLLLVAELSVLIPVYGRIYSFVQPLLASLNKPQSNSYNSTTPLYPSSTSAAPPNLFDVFLAELIPLAFLFEAALPILIPLIIVVVYRPYRRAWIGKYKSKFKKVKMRLTKAN